MTTNVIKAKQIDVPCWSQGGKLKTSWEMVLIVLFPELWVKKPMLDVSEICQWWNANDCEKASCGLNNNQTENLIAWGFTTSQLCLILESDTKKCELHAYSCMGFFYQERFIMFMRYTYVICVNTWPFARLSLSQKT